MILCEFYSLFYNTHWPLNMMLADATFLISKASNMHNLRTSKAVLNLSGLSPNWLAVILCSLKLR